MDGSINWTKAAKGEYILDANGKLQRFQKKNIVSKCGSG